MTASDRQYANRILSNAERYGSQHQLRQQSAQETKRKIK